MENACFMEKFPGFTNYFECFGTKRIDVTASDLKDEKTVENLIRKIR